MRVRRAFRFDDFRAVSHLLQPDAKKMVLDLQEHWGEASSVALLGCSTLIFRHWKAGYKPSGAARRAIWCVWCWTFHPDRLATGMDWITWGRVRMRPVPRQGKFVEDWQI